MPDQDPLAEEENTLKDMSKHMAVLKDLLASQKLSVLATQNDGQPYTNLVAFASTKDMKHLLFATARDTRKYGNLVADSRVSMLIDTRSNKETDFHKAVAVTAMGEAEEVADNKKKRLLKLYLDKHPHLKEFVTSPNCALFAVKVDSYYLVSKFQNVVELHPKP